MREIGMKRWGGVGLLIVALALSACSERSKEKAKEAAATAGRESATVVRQLKEKSSAAMEEAKRQAKEAVETVKEMGHEFHGKVDGDEKRSPSEHETTEH